jgi:hypothetical protein
MRAYVWLYLRLQNTEENHHKQYGNRENYGIAPRG